MKILYIMLLTLLISACTDRQQVDASSNIDISDCKVGVVNVEDTNGVHRIVTVIRCPNSSVQTSTSYGSYTNNAVTVSK